VVDNSDDAETPLVEFAVENVGAKPILAFWISYDMVVHGTNVTLGRGVNVNKQELILPPGKRRALAISNGDREKVVLSVDFVEFADGSTWGADTARYAESLAGERAGARAEAERLVKLLKTGGLQAVKDAAAEKVDYPDLTPETRREVSFLIGVRATRGRVLQASEKGGLSTVEAALRQPYDMSAASLLR
jgi:Holliday junction resolvase